ncbi:Uma2 family endonuclease [Sphingomonas sanxanigenens]|uniref:Putative restriction endonuclease domain-containing protein n=1 Tax=Sphingomonas sanxanigenens DSM 19645 = NX02 TaxID=1123269 RepID=W0AJP7_9SPHN|nr:Uma2 family endonuclease [Sphingomonas sanxanigenens]AHE56488.1 hypothetical protein NX02_24405 [Sphingomonas sanxanigenens DSM 19645 = NX02]
MTIFQNVRKGLIPARLTVAEVYALTAAGVLAEGDNFELIEGEIVPMPAAKHNYHEAMKSALTRAIILGTDAGTALFVEPSVTLSETTLVEPDLAVWPRGIGTQDVRGPELLILIEVAVSSIAYDLKVKAPLYAAAGVRDYWVVDAVRRTIRVHRTPENGRYADVEEYEAHDGVAALLLPGVKIRLDAID